MKSMQSVPSSLIARNESWVRQQANALARSLPSNVEKADLIQAGLIAVAQSALGFKWEGDHDSDEAKEAFVRYARLRVKGAMVDELRQMDQLARPQRRKIKVIQIARERWQALHGADPSLGELSQACGIGLDEISQLEQLAQMANVQSLDDIPEDDDRPQVPQPATPKDEVEARVDTAILMRRLAKYFETLPERDRQVIDAYFGIGMTPLELAGSMSVSVSRVSQIYDAACRRIAVHLRQGEERASDRPARPSAQSFNELVTRREAELARASGQAGWGELMEQVLTEPERYRDLIR